jgi:hypothetical protein
VEPLVAAGLNAALLGKHPHVRNVDSVLSKGIWLSSGFCARVLPDRLR